MDNDGILKSICRIIEARRKKDSIKEYRSEAVATLGKLVDMSEKYGFYGNLWAVYLTNMMVNSENAFSLACEIGGNAEGSISDLVIHDMEIMMGIYHADIAGLIKDLGMPALKCVLDYTPLHNSYIYNLRIRDRICILAEDMLEAPKASQMKGVLTSFYKQFGVGRLGLHKAFRLDIDHKENMTIAPIQKIPQVTLADLVGYDIPKQKLVENTEAFINGRPANNCLLFGDAGTGKSSSIKAIANEYYVQGLRVIEVYRHQFAYINELIAELKNRNYKFIIYLDDLSFEDFETEYKYLKAVIEGGLEKRPENILIYATSNRRHLIKETVSDRDDRDEEMHRSDTMAEKLSLSQRFGVSIYFGTPSKKEFDEIVVTLAHRSGLNLPDEEIIEEANKWELSHGGRSGRTARQFVDHMLGIKSSERNQE